MERVNWRAKLASSSRPEARRRSMAASTSASGSPFLISSRRSSVDAARPRLEHVERAFVGRAFRAFEFAHRLGEKKNRGAVACSEGSFRVPTSQGYFSPAHIYQPVFDRRAYSSVTSTSLITSRGPTPSNTFTFSSTSAMSAGLSLRYNFAFSRP